MKVRTGDEGKQTSPRAQSHHSWSQVLGDLCILSRSITWPSLPIEVILHPQQTLVPLPNTSST